MWSDPISTEFSATRASNFYLNLIVKKILQQRMQMSYHMWNTDLNIAFINLNFCVLKF